MIGSLLFILFQISYSNSCENLEGGVTYGSDDSGNVYNTTIFNSTNELLPILCDIWGNPNVYDVNVQFYKPTKSISRIKPVNNSCDGLKRSAVYGTNSEGFIIVVHVSDDLNEIVPLVCYTWTTPYVVLVSVVFEI